MLLALKPDDLKFSKLVSLFADTSSMENGKVIKSPSKFKTNDDILIGPNELPNFDIEKPINTTIGRLIYNKYVIEGSGMSKVIGYVDMSITNSANNSIEQRISQALLNDEIDRDNFDKYIDLRDNLGQQLHAVICTSFTENIITTPEAVMKEKNKLIEENKDALDKGDLATALKIEQALLAKAKVELKGDPAMDLYDSGARGTFNNNYKNNNLLKGPVYNNITKKFDFVSTSFMEGIKKEDIPVHGNSIIAGAYPSAVGTQKSGYFSKQILAALQTEVLDSRGSDCGTKECITVALTNDNINDFMYRYVVEGSGLDMIDEKNYKSYIGKTVSMRSPMMCTSDRICNKCMGDFFYKLGIENVGLVSSVLSSKLLNLKLKAKHDTTQKMNEIDINNVFIDKYIRC